MAPYYRRAMKAREQTGTRANDPTTLGELAMLFLRLGTTAFGGPAAHIAMMEDEVVRRRKWLTEERFLDLVGATNLIPGPNSTEMAIHIGYERRRWAGLVVAGACFIIPAALITGLLAVVYVRYGKLPQAAWLLYGVKPVVLAIVVQALWGLAPKAGRTRTLRFLGAAAGIATLAGLNEVLVLIAIGVGNVGIDRSRGRGDDATESAVAIVVPAASAATATAAAFSLGNLFWIFFKTGALLFGSGYVLIAFLRADLVTRLGWLTEAQLLDAVAIGQVTPGPVFTTATFIGYLLGGVSGAVVATVGIFLPAFFFVAVSGPLIPKLRNSARAAAFLDGVNVASLALMAVVTAQLGRAAIVDLVTLAMVLVAAVLLVRYRVSSTWLVLAGALIGLLAAHRFT